MDGLVDTVDLGLAIRHTSHTSTGEETQGTRDDTSFIANDITEQVAGDNDTVKLAGVLNHDHGSRVDKLVVDLHLRELLGHNLSDDLAPQTASSKHVGLVQAPNGERRVVLKGEVGSKTSDTLDLSAGVGLSIHCEARAVVFLALTKVDTTGQLTDDVKVDAAADLGLQGRVLDEGGSSEVAWTQVTECAHFLAQLEETLLRADCTGAPFLFPDQLNQRCELPAKA